MYGAWHRPIQWKNCPELLAVASLQAYLPLLAPAMEQYGIAYAIGPIHTSLDVH